MVGTNPGELHHLIEDEYSYSVEPGAGAPSVTGMDKNLHRRGRATSRPWRVSLAACVALPLSALTVPTGAAHAAEVVSRVVLTDPTGDVWAIGEGEGEEWVSAGDEPGLDVERAVVHHRRHRLVVRMTFTNLRRVEPQYYSAAFTAPKGYGAVFVSAEPGRWKGRSQLVDEQFGQVRCRGLRHRIDYATEKVVMSVPRSCIDKPRWVRVAMAVYGFRGETEAEFQELTDNPHSTGHEEDAQTRRLYRQVLPNQMLSIDPSGDVVKHDDVDPETTVDPTWENGDITRFTARHRHRRVSARMTFAALEAGPKKPWAYHRFVFVTEDGGHELVGTVGVDGGGGQGTWELDGRRVTCRGLRHSIDYRADEVRVSVPRSCLGRPAWVRVGGSSASWSEAQETYRSDDGLRKGKNGRIDPAPLPVGRRLLRG